MWCIVMFCNVMWCFVIRCDVMCACESVYVYFYFFFITFCLCRELRLWPRKNVRSLTNTGLRPRPCSLKPPTELMQDVSKCSARAQTRVRLTYRCAATAFPVGKCRKNNANRPQQVLLWNLCRDGFLWFKTCFPPCIWFVHFQVERCCDVRF